MMNGDSKNQPHFSVFHPVRLNGSFRREFLGAYLS